MDEKNSSKLIMDEMLNKFEELFGAGGDIRSYFAPGRVNLIGAYRL